MSLSPFEHPFLAGLFGDAELAALFTAEADIAAMLRFEIALAQAEADCGVFAQETAVAIAKGLEGFKPDMDGLREGTAKDGVVIPEFVRQLRRTVGGEAAETVHFGATSQDVIDTSLMLRLKPASDVLKDRLTLVTDALSVLAERDGARSMMGHTRMQAAITITAADRVASWRALLMRSTDRLASYAEQGFAVQLGGAAGTLDKLGEKGAAVRARLAEILGLADRPQWQSQRDGLAEFAGLLSLVTGSLGKLGQDIALMAELGGEIRLSGGGGSSAMPHKQNPVAAELLVTLARFNATQVSAMHQALVHEQERSGAAWGLEWLTLPQMVMTTGVALTTANRLLGQIERMGRMPPGAERMATS
ncbi:3-carboxy-cis,cis-muconate cycloisomerase [Xaviernesmea oryzae]|uniref:3-carboxy-cis,cis-muconate cycloisomerase n=1 Tax=Xaviernesmea oryzae TaxID=464029 RepID=A0A1Q9B3G7_9HYPH|nr:3-carboxy-cis,cis-muconate cycloisomerase [Xaviernesmea oryzae]OLP62604.1 3-carboxy-cis,cis-muconate cycloisomerase [Xaviernesmea oryzae]SEM26091.1 3-carboxy-cis,cis-muconate cycloisomerase [Xaviernesmea oryzae]